MRLLPCLVVVMFWSVPLCAAENPYVGSKRCASCHEQEYTRFQQHSKKARSWNSVVTMAPKLTQQELEGCYGCHTTGYGKGGFVSYKDTPHLADVGCETCHGPGAAHVQSEGDPATITRSPTLEQCMVCHNENRIKAFNFTPLIHSGAH